jgi:hypothetical protein
VQKRTIRAQLLRLADAMMKGGKKRQQCQGKLFDLVEIQEMKKDGWVSRYKLGGSCALGAVYEGLFGTPPVVEDGLGAQVNGGDAEIYERLQKKLPVLDLSLRDLQHDPDPDDLSLDATLQNEIITRNDESSTPRWKIARWIRGLAAKL